MSEFNPFSAAEEAPAYVPEESEESATDDRKKVVALGALAAVALGAGAFLFLGGGGDEEEFIPVTRAPRAAAPAADSEAEAPGKLPLASAVTLGRNPFRALYVAPAAAVQAPTTTGSAPTTPTTTGGDTTPIVIVDSAPPPATSGGTTAPPPPAAAPAPAPAPAPAQSTVALKGVAANKDGSNPTGSFVYDGKQLTGAPGDVMDGKLLVISLQRDHTGSWFAVLQLGDGSPFEVHENQLVVVQ